MSRAWDPSQARDRGRGFSLAKTIASIISYSNGWLGFVVIEAPDEGNDSRSRITYADTFEACALEALPEVSAFGKDKRRVFDDAHREAIKTQLGTLLLAYRPERIICEVPSIRSILAVKVAEAILEYLADYTKANGIPDVERVPSSWVGRYGGPIGTRDVMRQAVVAHLDLDEGVGLLYDGTLKAAAMAAAIIFGTDDVELAPRIRRAHGTGNKATRIDCPTFEAATVEPIALELVEPGEIEEDPELEKLVTPAVGKIVAGLDSGSRSLAIAIGQGNSRPVTLRYLRTFEVGESVPLLKPKVIKYAGGVEHTVTTKRVLSADFVSALADEVVRILVQYKVERLIVEHVDSVHISAEQVKASSSIATALIRTVWLATEIAVRARFAGIEVVRVRHISWIAKVCGKLRDEDGERMLTEAVAEAVKDWPRGTNEHEYDAGGIMVYGVLSEEEVTVVAEKREKKEAVKAAMKYPRKSKVQIERERREAAGCRCATKHQNTCPLYQPSRKMPAWAAKALGLAI